MSVSSVKNLNGETFSAVQDTSLTEFVQTNSASWGQGGGGGTGDMETALLEYNADDQITGYNGSAFAGQGGGGTTGEYLPLSATGATIGSENNADNNNSYAFGKNVSATNRGVSFGQKNCSDDYSLSFGGLASSFSSSLAGGYNVSARKESVALGAAITAMGWSFGQGGDVKLIYPTDSYRPDSACSFGQGRYVTASGSFNLVQGRNVSAKGDSNLVQGKKCTANGNTNFVQGSTNSAYGDDNFIHGWNISSQNGGASLGNNLTNNGINLLLGQYNQTTSNAAIVCCYGEPGSQATAYNDYFVVYKNGAVSAAGKISANGVELGSVPYNMVYTASLPAEPDSNTLYLIPEA